MFFIFYNIWDNPSHLTFILLKMVETTNQQSYFGTAAKLLQMCSRCMQVASCTVFALLYEIYTCTVYSNNMYIYIYIHMYLNSNEVYLHATTCT